MPFQNNVLAGASGATGYEIPYSLRFRAANSANLRKTFSSASTNFDVQTISLWFKRGRLTLTDSPIANCLITQFGSGGNYPTFELGFEPSSDQLVFMNRSASTSYNHRLVTTAQYRDPSAWYHLVIAYDSSLATSTDRIKMWINGVQITSFSTATYPAQNLDSQLANNTYSQPADIGSFANGSRYFDGYMAEVNFIDGQALTPSSFGQTDATTGVWVPKKYAGSYGTNGFYLKFADASAATAAAIGKDSSGNGNNWTPSGISVTSGTTFDQSLDTPTLGYPVWSPIDKATVTVSEGNTAAVPAADVHAIRATMALPATGKWYWEVAVSALGYGTGLGIADNASNLTANASSPETRTYQFGSWFNSFNGGVVQYGTNQNVLGATNWTAASQPAANDIIMIAVDMDNGSMWVGKNGTWFNSSGTANPATNTDPRWTGLSGTTWFPYMSGYGSVTPVTCRINFGQRAFAYTPPSGFKALNTENITSTAVSTSGSFTGNAAADGPFIWANGNPATLTINGNSVTFGTDADKTAGGFKLRTSSASYNTSGTNNWTSTAGNRFVQNKKPNNAQVNP